MKKFSRFIAIISALCLLPVCGCAKQELPPSAKEGTLDLMDQAVAFSGYASTGLYDLRADGYGIEKFSDYLTLQANPLSGGDYVLSTQAPASQIGAKGKGVAEFCSETLQTKGYKADLSANYTVYNDPAEALAALYDATGVTGGLNKAKQSLSALSPRAKKPLAHWLSAAAYAYTVITEQTSFFSEEEFDRMVRFPYISCATSQTEALEKLLLNAQLADREELLRAGQMMITATATLSSQLKPHKALTVKDEPLTIQTPAGAIVLGSTGNDGYSSPEALLLIDPAGNDTYEGQVAVNRSLQNPISVALDLGGDDNYLSDLTPTQGCGIMGTGLLFDLEGNDCYVAEQMAQGYALLGVGLLYDGGGNDSYRCHVSGQAAGYYGFALLADAAGDDRYHGFGYVQAAAGTQCMAYLVDCAGNDTYDTPEETPTGYDELDYGGEHSGKTGNFSQGCGWGQRSIDTGNNGVAGGIAGMIDLGGNDTYNGGLWVQGTGYWSGIGFLYNKGGNDEYTAYYYSQAGVAHYGAGLLVDIDGNDLYTLTRGAGLAFTWDRGVTMLLDDGGNDTYDGTGSCGAVANSAYDSKGYENQDMTYAFLLDTEGNDIYIHSQLQKSWSFGRGGFLIDGGGKDSYSFGFAEDDLAIFGMDHQEGGVFSDASANGSEIPYFRFWYLARSKNSL